MSRFESVNEKPCVPVEQGIKARCVQGEHLTMAVVELDAEAVIDEHAHAYEQVGLVLDGYVTLQIGAETKELQIGDTYLVPPNTPHKATAGPTGAVIVDAYSPARDDWKQLEPLPPRFPLWP